jgi:hypothetical protein
MKKWVVVIGLSSALACTAKVQDPPIGDPIEPTFDAPDMLTATLFGGGGHLTWRDRSTDEAEFRIERASGAEFQLLASVVFDTIQYHDDDIVAGRTYAYRVKASADGKQSGYSNVASLTVPDDSPVDAGEPNEDAAVIEADAGVEEADATIQEDAAEPPVVSFRQDIVPILQASCGTSAVGCHSRDAYAGNANMDCRGWLALEDRPLGSQNPANGNMTGCPDRTLYQRLTELTAWMCDPQRAYVVPFNVGASQIYNVIGGDPSHNGTCNRMPNVPLGAMPPPTSVFRISEEEIAKIAEWINDGALDN